jgi:hydroxymethylpyrimidine pyrophosphatase-like HAD family hydrolase
MSDVMYVGDADNDLSALRRVGHPVAMANASPSVLGVAKHVVGHVDAGGLAQALHLAISATAASCG